MATRREEQAEAASVWMRERGWFLSWPDVYQDQPRRWEGALVWGAGRGAHGSRAEVGWPRAPFGISGEVTHREPWVALRHPDQAPPPGRAAC